MNDLEVVGCVLWGKATTVNQHIASYDLNNITMTHV